MSAPAATRNPLAPVALLERERCGPAFPRTLVDLLRRNAVTRAQARAYAFLSHDLEVEAGLTWEALDARARAVAAELQRRHAPGEPALLLFPPGLAFLEAFFGCVYAGVVAVPAPLPRPNRTADAVAAIAENAAPALTLTTAACLSRLRERGWGDCLAADQVPDAMARRWREPDLDGEDLALLQYTSGSTSSPRGVMVTHANLLHNQEAIRGAFRQSESTIILSWLPLYHDMGLIGNVLQALYLGVPCLLMSPLAVLQRPIRWLQAISRYRATSSGGPNFIYDLCARKLAPGQADGLDLRCWDTAFNGAEPVRWETLEAFAAAFVPAGFRREAFHPCYGMAEATLLVSCARGVRLRKAVAAPRVSCGRPAFGQARIVDPETLAPCRPGEVGEIWLAGGSVARGYWRDAEATAAAFGARLPTGEGPFLRTGDLGFVADGELCITGRLKDLIIVAGRNHHSEDVERTAARSHPAFRAGGAAAFAVESAGGERLVLALEVERRRGPEDAGASAEALAAVRHAVAEEHDLALHDVLFFPPGGLPRTSSGKVRRQACRALYLAQRGVGADLPGARA
jgi:acyl-CoA synthetase (AMP-forming)/AMP-acid ligase II